MSLSEESVLAVVVVFNRNIKEVPCINQLKLWVKEEKNHGSSLFLKSCLIYDNSPVKMMDEDDLDPESFSFMHNTLNGGTRSAYLAALQIARDSKCKWILFLDHDTDLPIDFFQAADIALEKLPKNNLVCAVVPLMFDGATPISPTLISKYGRGQPWSEESRIAGGCSSLTAISSAALVRVSSLASVLPIPACFSLDYLDHWLFRAMQNRGEHIAISTARVAHSLSVQSMRSIDAKRYRSILMAEFQFLSSGKVKYHLALHVTRLAFRAVKLMLTTQRLDLVEACFSATLDIFQINKSNE